MVGYHTCVCTQHKLIKTCYMYLLYIYTKLLANVIYILQCTLNILYVYREKYVGRGN